MEYMLSSIGGFARPSAKEGLCGTGTDRHWMGTQQKPAAY
jgi:hypothetical protein